MESVHVHACTYTHNYALVQVQPLKNTQLLWQWLHSCTLIIILSISFSALLQTINSNVQSLLLLKQQRMWLGRSKTNSTSWTTQISEVLYFYIYTPKSTEDFAHAHAHKILYNATCVLLYGQHRILHYISISWIKLHKYKQNGSLTRTLCTTVLIKKDGSFYTWNNKNILIV